LKVELRVELEFASFAINLLMAVWAYRVVVLCAQLTRDLLSFKVSFIS